MPRYNDREWWGPLCCFSLALRCRVIEALYRQGRLTDWQLWDVLSSYQSPIPTSAAAQVYRNLGFQPYAGYPLTKEERSCTG